MIYRLRLFLSLGAGKKQEGVPETAQNKGKRGLLKMVDLSEKSKEEIFREKKEAELREAKRKEGEWKRRMDKERKCMIGGTFLKYFKDALLFE